MYPYTADLICLGFCRPSQDLGWSALNVVSTQLNVAAWEVALQAQLDRAFSSKGLRYGFCIGFNRQAPLKSASRNMQSALEHPGIIDEYLQKESSRGQMLGPFSPESLQALPELQLNRFSVIPEGAQYGQVVPHNGPLLSPRRVSMMALPQSSVRSHTPQWSRSQRWRLS